MIRVDLSKIVINESDDSQYIVLREHDGDRSFPIVIGMYEALAIDRGVRGIESPRPMPHDLLAAIVEGLGGRLDRVEVSALKDNTFFARLMIERDGETVEIDSRPSDAIAVASRTGAEIYVSPEVLEEANGGSL